MEFFEVGRKEAKPYDGRRACYLAHNSWNDFGFNTMFEATLYDDDGTRYELGTVRITRRGLISGYVQLPQSPFTALDGEYCSLGGGREYYAAVAEVPSQLRRDYLRALRDCVESPLIFEEFRQEPSVKNSLLRDVSARDVTMSYPAILRGDAELTPYRFNFDFDQDEVGSQRLEFRVAPRSIPRTNLHVLIGRNGVGKTRLLAGMAKALGEEDNAFGIDGTFAFEEVSGAESDFLNLVIVSFSAFDRFEPFSAKARTDGALPYFYVGLKLPRTGPAEPVGMKSPEDLDREFETCLANLTANPTRLGWWLEAMETVSSDQGIRDIGISNLFAVDPSGAEASMRLEFSKMSSGHKIVLLTLSRLVECVSDRSLVLLDEPETHLHPPLLSSFIRAICDLLYSRNAVAIVATHSPVVLQEVPASCVYRLHGTAGALKAERLDEQTFAENVSVLTRRVFGLEVEESGFYKLLSDAAKNSDYDEVMNRFGGQVGGEGRALTRAFVSKKP